MTEGTIFKVRINDGEPEEFVTATGKVMYVALQVVLSKDELLPLPSMLNPIRVEIWCEAVPEIGPFHFLVFENDVWSGQISVLTGKKINENPNRN